jgi:hypothetical protein
MASTMVVNMAPYIAVAQICGNSSNMLLQVGQGFEV